MQCKLLAGCRIPAYLFFSIRHALLVFNGSGVDFETNLRPLRNGEEKCGSRFLLDDFPRFMND